MLSSAMLRDCNDEVICATPSMSIRADASGFIGSNALQTCCYYNGRRRWQAERVCLNQDTGLQTQVLVGGKSGSYVYYLKPGEPRWHRLVTFVMLVSAN
jgi:hypothetical protein